MRNWIKGLITRIRNSGYRLSKTRFEQQRYLLKSDTTPKYLLCPHCLGKVAICHFQPNEQHQEQETTRKAHVQGQECEGCQETKE